MQGRRQLAGEGMLPLCLCLALQATGGKQTGVSIAPLLMQAHAAQGIWSSAWQSVHSVRGPSGAVPR
jgi:hypothetical protein